MLSYTDIIRRAYYITLRHKILWLFGFFVVGGFNLNFFSLPRGNMRGLQTGFRVRAALAFFQAHPGALALASLAVLLISLISLVVANWSSVMLVLSVHSVIRSRFPEVSEQLQKSRRPLVPTIKMSLLTSSLMVLVAAALLIPPFFLVSDPDVRTLLLAAAAALLLPLAFTISCVNIFATFFIILYKQRLGPALNLATDFFVTKWTQILGLVVVLIVIYGVSYMVGVSLIYSVNVFLRWLIESLSGLGYGWISAIMSVFKAVLGLVFWLILAGLNVFFNTSILLLFLELVTPIKAEQEGEKRMTVAPEAA